MPAAVPALDPLRPRTLAEFGGQAEISEQLDIILSAARDRGDVGEHLLFYGPPGLGKTTLAHIIAAELELPIICQSGPAIEKPGDIVSLLTSLNTPAVVFVDEIHRMPKAAEEQLYTAMEDRRIDLLVGEGPQARTVHLPLPAFLLVGATTEPGAIAAPLRDRFGFVGRLRPYSLADLATILERSAQLLDVDLTEGTAAEIARRARSTPRVANMLLRRVRDWAATRRDTTGPITPDEAIAALEAFGIDADGLDGIARDVLVAIAERFAGGPVGLSTLAAAVDEAPVTIETAVEPHLLRLGLLARTPRGRMLTADGIAKAAQITGRDAQRGAQGQLL